MLPKARRIGSAGCRRGAEVPLQIADPQHQLGDGGGARVELQAEELVRVDRLALRGRQRLLARRGRPAPPAPRPPAASSAPGRRRGSCRCRRPGSSTRVAQSWSWKAAHAGDRAASASPSAFCASRPPPSRIPVGPQRLHHRRLDQPLDIGAGRVVGAQRRRSFGSSACSSSVPKIAGSTSRQSCAGGAPAARRSPRAPDRKTVAP